MALPTKATHRDTREHNERLVMRTLYDLGPISRAEVARLTGLTRTTVSDVVAGLLDGGVVREVGWGPSTGGKAPVLVEVDDDARQVVGLDLGERVFTGALVNLRGEVRRTVELPVEGRDGDEAVALVFRLVDELLAEGRPALLGIGIGTPGLVDSRTGTIRWAVNLAWRDLRLGDLVAARYGIPVNVANDSQAAALAEYTYAGESRVPNLIAIRIGRGIGAGLVLRGALFQGDGFGAGEIGHTVVEEDGARCRCGRRGCLETVAGVPAIEARAAAAAARHPGSTLAGVLAARGRIGIDDVRAALEAGDAAAREVAAEAGTRLGRAIAPLIGALDVERIVLLGPVTELGDPWLDAVRAEAFGRSLGLLARRTRIVIGRQPSNVVVLGASALLVTRELGLGSIR